MECFQKRCRIARSLPFRSGRGSCAGTTCHQLRSQCLNLAGRYGCRTKTAPDEVSLNSPFSSQSVDACPDWDARQYATTSRDVTVEESCSDALPFGRQRIVNEPGDRRFVLDYSPGTTAAVRYADTIVGIRAAPANHKEAATWGTPSGLVQSLLVPCVMAVEVESSAVGRHKFEA